MNNSFPVITTFINFVAILVIISIQMDYVALGVGTITVVGSTLTGVWWIVNHLINKGMDKQHLKEFEKQTKEKLDSINFKIDTLHKDVSDNVLFRQHMKDFEKNVNKETKELRVNFIAFSSEAKQNIENMKDTLEVKIDKLLEMQRGQGEAIARLEGKADTLQSR